MIRFLGPDDRHQLDSFLRSHAATSMFLRANLRIAGLDDRGERYQASYLGAFRGAELVGVIAHCWNGMILPQAPQTGDMFALAGAVLKLPTIALRGITGASGDDRQVSAIMSRLDVGTNVQMDQVEGLFSLDLAELRLPPSLAQGHVTCRRAEERDFQPLLAWRLAYDVEALSRRDDAAKADDTAAWLRDQLHRGEVFVLEDPSSGSLLATSAFNATLSDMVQIGAVYTPPPMRRKAMHARLSRGNYRSPVPNA